MKTLRQVTFSKKERNKEHKSKDGTKEKLIGGGLILGGVVGNKVTGNKAANMLMKKDTEEGKQLLQKLKKTAEDQGTKVSHTIEGNSLYGSKGTHKFKKVLGKLSPEAEDVLDNILGEPGKAGDSINSVKRADIFAHELGHSKHFQGRDGSKVGKIAHKLMVPSKVLTTTPIGLGISIANGYSSGKKAAEAEAKGEKESTWNKVRAAAVPAAVSAPLLAAEGAASLKGLKELKKAGASKNYLKSSKKNLALALGTYATVPLITTGLGVAARGVGKSVTRSKLKMEKRKKKEE